MIRGDSDHDSCENIHIFNVIALLANTACSVGAIQICSAVHRLMEISECAVNLTKPSHSGVADKRKERVSVIPTRIHWMSGDLWDLFAGLWKFGHTRKAAIIYWNKKSRHAVDLIVAKFFWLIAESMLVWSNTDVNGQQERLQKATRPHIAGQGRRLYTVKQTKVVTVNSGAWRAKQKNIALLHCITNSDPFLFFK